MHNRVQKLAGIGKAARIMLPFVFALFAAHAHSASKTVLVLGDSLSAEYGLVRGTGWVALLDKRLVAEKIDAAIVNASISGETTSGGLTRLPALLDKYKPAIVVIELGANDGLRGLPFATMQNNLRTMVDAAKKIHARVLLIGMKLPPNYGNDYTQRFYASFADVAKETGVALVPFLLERMATQPELFQQDRFHPVAEAEPAILDTVWPYLKPLLVKK